MYIIHTDRRADTPFFMLKIFMSHFNQTHTWLASFSRIKEFSIKRISIRKISEQWRTLSLRTTSNPFKCQGQRYRHHQNYQLPFRGCFAACMHRRIFSLFFNSCSCHKRKAICSVSCCFTLRLRQSSKPMEVLPVSSISSFYCNMNAFQLECLLGDSCCGFSIK